MNLRLKSRTPGSFSNYSRETRAAGKIFNAPGAYRPGHKGRIIVIYPKINPLIRKKNHRIIFLKETHEFLRYNPGKKSLIEYYLISVSLKSRREYGR
jgi:hypothetical protein